MNSLIFSIFIPEIIFSILIIFILLYGIYIKNILKKSLKIKKILYLLLFFFFFIAFFTVEEINKAIFVFSEKNFWIYDNYNKIIRIIFWIFILFYFIQIFDKWVKMLEKKNNFEFLIYFLTSIISLSFLILSNDFIWLYLSLEAYNISSYGLCFLYNKKYTKGLQSGFKYFILNAFSSCFLIFGISLLYFFFGTTNFYELYLLFLFEELIFFPKIYLYISIILIFVGFLFKLNIAPFHFWIFELSKELPWTILYFFFTLSKISLIFLIFKINVFVYSFLILKKIDYILLICSFVSIILGSLGALFEKNLKLILSFSSISNMGFISLCIYLNNYNGFKILLIYLIIYLITQIGIFSFFFSKNEHWTLSRQIKNKKLIYLSNFKYLLNNNSSKNLICSLFFSFLLFSSAGIPPFAGFFSKFFLLQELINQKLVFIILIFLILNNLNVFFYLKIIKVIFFESTIKKNQQDNIKKTGLKTFLNFFFFCLSSIFHFLFVFILFLI